MGYNTVAVIYNDHTGEIAKSGRVGERIAAEIRDWHTGNHSLRGWFGAGRILSMDHADGYQIVVVHANTGNRIEDATGLPSYVLEQMAYCLRQHGWKASPPKKTKVPK